MVEKPQTLLNEPAEAPVETRPAEGPPAMATEPFYPHHLIRKAIQVLAVFAVLATLATLWPAPMGAPADPTRMPADISPEWLFLAAHHVMDLAKLIPVAPLLQRTVGVSIVVAGFLVIFLVPYLDRGAERRARRRPIAMALLALAVAAYVALTLWPQLVRYLA